MEMCEFLATHADDVIVATLFFFSQHVLLATRVLCLFYLYRSSEIVLFN